ncbi:MAG TPA: hypothetical protein VMW25_01150, partial [Clostridia bacterium]|nr:hypothetical protein [Clostridia bacterium]
MADIDLAIRYTDTDMKRLEADLDRVRTSAVTIQTTLDKINLKNLEKQFQSLGKVAMNAFGRGLQIRIAAITARIGGQREALKSLIRQYALLAVAQNSIGKGGPLITASSGGGVAGEAWKKSQGAEWYAEKSPYTNPKQLAVMERRNALEKEMLGTQRSVAQYAKQFDVSQTTIRRDQKAIAEARTQRFIAERKMLSSAATPEQKQLDGALGRIHHQIQQMHDQPTAAVQTKPIETAFKKIDAQSKIVSQDVNTRMRELFKVPISMETYEKNIDAAVAKINSLDNAQRQLGEQRQKAMGKGAPVEAIEKEMLNNTSKRQIAEDDLRKNIDAQNLAKAQSISTEKTLTQQAEKTNASLEKKADLTKSISTETKN